MAVGAAIFKPACDVIETALANHCGTFTLSIPLIAFHFIELCPYTCVQNGCLNALQY